MRQGKCDRCGKETWINFCYRTICRKFPGGWMCAACFEAIAVARPPIQIGVASRGQDNNPGFDNVIRAMEEDR